MILHPVIASYFIAANSRQPAALAECFTADAVVHDESADRIGLEEIILWAQDTGDRYQPEVEILTAKEDEGRTIVTGKVSGSFPGSPIELDYTFTLGGDKIRRLEIS